MNSGLRLAEPRPQSGLGLVEPLEAKGGTFLMRVKRVQTTAGPSLVV